MIAVIALASSAALIAPTQDGRKSAVVSVLDVGAERAVHSALEGDLDGDGQDDLVLCLSRSAGGRELVCYRARKDPKLPTFAAACDALVDLTPDVVAFAIGEVDPSSPGKELILFSARGAFLCRPYAAVEKRFARLVECDLLWQLADPEDCFGFQAGLVDFDRDGAMDLVLPEPSGYAIARAVRQKPDQPNSFPALIHLRVPEEIQSVEERQLGGSMSSGGDDKREQGDKRDKVEISFGTRETRARTLLSVSEAVPAPQLADFDADGRLDVQAQGVRTMWVWLQTKDGGFWPEPQRAFPLPVTADRERKLDASYSAHVIDADQDGRSDLAILAGDKRSDDVRTQILLFVQGKGRGEAAKTEAAPLFGPKGLPQQLLVLGGFGLGAYFDDLDGDLRPDLFVRTVRPDLIDQLRSASSETVDADMLVYRNENGELAKKPTLSWRVQIPISDFDLTLRFVGDLDGDRISDLAVRSEPEKLRLLAMRRAKEGWQLDPKPLYEAAIQAKAQILLLRRSDRAVSDIGVVEERQVRLVRFP